MKPEERIAIIKEIDNQIRNLYAKKNYLIDTCKHKIIKTSTDSAICANCGTHFGWWCPKSPDHLCNYRDPKTKLYGDWCIYCGLAEERK